MRRIKTKWKGRFDGLRKNMYRRRRSPRSTCETQERKKEPPSKVARPIIRGRDRGGSGGDVLSPRSHGRTVGPRKAGMRRDKGGGSRVSVQ